MSASAVPAPDPPLPRCDEYPSRRPITFVATSSGSGLNLATSEVKLAPSLTAAQKEIDKYAREWELLGQQAIVDGGSFNCPKGGGCGAAVGCSVVRSDGELLALRCSAMLNSGMGGPMIHDAQTWVYERRGDELVKLSLKDMFPGAAEPLVDTVEAACKSRGWSTSGGEGSEAGFDEVHPYTTSIGLQASGGRWQSWRGELPLTRASDLVGCGPLGKLRQFSADTKGEGDAWPLEIAFANVGPTDGSADRILPRFHSADPRRARLAATLDAEIDAVSGRNPGYLGCDIGTSTESIISVGCGGQGAEHRLTYRLADASRVTTADVFASVGSVKAAVKSCYGKYLAAPKRPEEFVQLKELPALTAEDFSAFLLVQSGVLFDLKMDDVLGSGRTERCLVPYGTLSTSLAALAKPAAKP